MLCIKFTVYTCISTLTEQQNLLLQLCDRLKSHICVTKNFDKFFNLNGARPCHKKYKKRALTVHSISFLF